MINSVGSKPNFTGDGARFTSMNDPLFVEAPFEVQKPQDNIRIDRFLALRLTRYSRARVQALIRESRVFSHGRLAKASSRVRAGETVIIRYPRKIEPECPIKSLTVLYEDEDLIAVNKPAGLLSHPSGKSVKNTATEVLKRQFPNIKLRPAHRLDRETSGVLLLAKSSEIARILCETFSAHQVQKEYHAAIVGRFPWKMRTVEVPIGRENGAIYSRQTTGKGRWAKTEFESLFSADDYSLVAARPKTGRLHQIRVHLAYLGYPIAGDKLYINDGKAYLKAVEKTITESDLKELGAKRQMLHAFKLSFRHPRTGLPLQIRADWPEDFKISPAAVKAYSFLK